MSGSYSNNIILIDEHIIENGIQLSRIVAIKDFDNVRRGDIGGFVESHKNIARNAWIVDNKQMNGNSILTCKAFVEEYKIVSGMAA